MGLKLPGMIFFSRALALDVSSDLLGLESVQTIWQVNYMRIREQRTPVNIYYKQSGNMSR